MKNSVLLKRYAGYGLLAFSLFIVVLTITYYPSHFDDVSTENAFLDRQDYKTFYGAAYYVGTKPPSSAPPQESQESRPSENDTRVAPVRAFVHQYGLQKAHILEIGAGRGTLQDVVADYTALEISSELKRFFHKPFVEASATNMPFKGGEFDAIWTVNVLEHVPKPEQALSEMRRVLKDQGLLYLGAAWQCRSWAAEGYQVRPYSDFDFLGKLIKASIPLRDSTAYRALYTFPIRLMRLTTSLATTTPTRFQYNLLTPNYERYWQSDSDAINSMDPYEAILWFRSRGDDLLSYDGGIDPFFVRSGTLVIRINKRTK
jgi:SAM-dependent methyltransferase